MPTLKCYLFEKNLTGSAVVAAIGQDDGQHWVRLDRTWFHPQGGGQKSDRGTISGVTTTHSAKVGDEVNHYVEDASVFVVGQEVPVEVDAEWRQANSTLHSSGHLIASVAHDRFPGLRAVAGHHWPGEARVEFEGEQLPDLEHFRRELAAGVLRAVEEDLPIFIVGDPLVARAIQVGTFAAIPCGGTHMDRAGELSALEVAGIKVKGERLRVSYH